MHATKHNWVDCSGCRTKFQFSALRLCFYQLKNLILGLWVEGLKFSQAQAAWFTEQVTVLKGFTKPRPKKSKRNRWGLNLKQISANNSTPLRYSKKLGIRLLLEYEYRAESGVLTRLEKYSNRNFKIRRIRAIWKRSGICASTEHNFWFQISSFDST